MMSSPMRVVRLFRPVIFSRINMKSGYSGGFSLVELAIVLVVLGLLVGGVLVGRSLIRNAEMQSVISDVRLYQSATQTFQKIYGGFPGDMINATDYWGALDGGDGIGSDCTTIIATDKRTCNGDGNHQISAATVSEYFYFWQHLANAELISGSYTGVSGSASNVHHIPGVNCPVSSLGNHIGWSIPHFRDYAGDSMLWARTNVPGHTLTIGGATNNYTFQPVFTVEEAYSIDRKIDDGLPGLGFMQIMYWPQCSTASAPNEYETAEYRLTNNNRNQCVLIFPEAINP